MNKRNLGFGRGSRNLLASSPAHRPARKGTVGGTQLDVSCPAEVSSTSLVLRGGPREQRGSWFVSLLCIKAEKVKRPSFSIKLLGMEGQVGIVVIGGGAP